MGKSIIEEIITIGTLRKAIEDLSDDKMIHCQVVASGRNGGAWNMMGMFFYNKDVPFASLCLTHPELLKMPEMENV